MIYNARLHDIKRTRSFDLAKNKVLGGGNFVLDHCFSFKTAFPTVGNAFLKVRNECGGQVIPDCQECIPDRR